MTNIISFQEQFVSGIPLNRLICAIDFKEVQPALDLCNQIKSSVGLIKLGLEFFTMNGPQGVKIIKECGVPIFLDLKFHDIPNTVAQTVRSAVRLGIDMLTIHTSGGKEMMLAAVNSAKDEAARLGVNPPLILGVTVLTSMAIHDLKDVGVMKSMEDQVLSLAGLAKESGLGGIVCSPLEVALINNEFGNSLKLIVPGIRPQGSAMDDQKRTMTPHEAVENGADFIVVGRPITKAANPLLAAQNICAAIKTPAS